MTQKFLILTHLGVILGKFMQSYSEGITVKFHDYSTNDFVKMIL